MQKWDTPVLYSAVQYTYNELFLIKKLMSNVYLFQSPEICRVLAFVLGDSWASSLSALIFQY